MKKNNDVIEFAGGAVSNLVSSAIAKNPIAVLEVMTSTIKEYLVIKEQETTKRIEISARKEVFLAEIQVKKEFITSYLDKTFDERASNFKKYFEVVDNALKNDKTEELIAGLNAINDLAKVSPFKDLETISKNMKNSKFEHDF